MLSTKDDEYKTRTTTHTSGGGLGKKKTTTQTWTEDNEYANNVDLTTDGNILMNYHGVGAPADNKGVFAQGVNFNAGGAVLGYSEGNIYEQGTKDRLNSEYSSRTRKSWLGINYGKSSDYVNTNRERYVHSQLYGDAGITFEADGKLKVEGADVQSSGNIFLKGKQGVEILPGIENGIRYEEHKKTGFTASFSGGSAFVGMEMKKNQAMTQSVNNVGSIINSRNGNVVLAGDYVVGNAVKIGAGEDIFIDGKTGVLIVDATNERNSSSESSISRVGLYASADGKKLTASAGLEAVFAGEEGTITSLIPERSTVVAQNIWIKSGDGNITLQGDYGAEENILVTAENGRIYIKDSRSEVYTSDESMKARMAIGAGVNLGGFKDTLKMFKDTERVLRNIGELPKIVGFATDVIGGKSLLESLEGREKSIELWSTIFTGPSSGGVSGTGGLQASFEKSENISEYIQNITTNVRAGRDITFKSKDFETYGGAVRAENDLSIDAKTVSINASLDTYMSKGNSRGINLNSSLISSEHTTTSLNYGKSSSYGSCIIIRI